MSLLTCIEEHQFSDVTEFINKWDIKNQFKEKYNVFIDEWDYPIPDQEVITYFLEKWGELYLLDYIDAGNLGHFILREFELPKTTK